jgi:Raf kinase inhibitor-like YbhB/YbcL family protein
MNLHSPDIKAGSTIPKAYVHGSAGGENQSPALEWSSPPTGTRGFAVTCYDPDAPTGSGWWHWQIFDIPADATGLARGAGNAEGSRPAGARQSRNDYGESAYGGPAPPPGDKPHRYVTTVFALGRRVRLAAGFDEAQLLRAIRGNVLARGSLVGRYAR